MSQQLSQDLMMIQKGIFEETLDEDMWFPQLFLADAALRRNALIMPEDEGTIKLFDVGKVYQDHREAFEALPSIAATAKEPRQWAHFVVFVDLDTQEGRALLEELSRFGSVHPEIELVLAHNPVGSAESGTYSIISRHAKEGKEFNWESLASLAQAVQDAGKNHDEGDSGDAAQLQGHTQALASSFGIQAGQNGVVLNGRLLGPIPSGTSLTAEDLEQLLSYERAKRIYVADDALEALGQASKRDSPLEAAEISSLLALSTVSDVPEGIFDGPPPVRTAVFERWQSEHSAIILGNRDTASVQVVVAIDPVAETTQRWVPILKILSDMNGVYLKLFLNPKDRYTELPTKRFYRHVLDSKPLFHPNGSLEKPQASFQGIPEDALLNLGMDLPPSWLVAPKDCVYDPDNIKLSSLPDGKNLDATYELEHILIEGHSRDVTTNMAPRGVQLLLGTEKEPHFADTIIMANLGYFQFKANPGLWNINLQSGRSERIYKIDSLGTLGYDPHEGDETTEVALTSFQGKTLYPRLSRKPGQEEADVLEDSPGSAQAILNRGLNFASSTLSNLGLTKSAHADINIFSVASGHLYERMLNIMMVSVMKHTQHSVKFWFIEQFLSPSFKASLPTLALHYNFQYEMVTYKWPHWLRAQREKQREIWGYKILFLDVLFPLSLDKVIFVDADQIVRTDMYSLVKHDLQGAPYGFTPMCDSRTEMEGFRFWKQGYWASFLRGLPYHISALYVVDLKKFRAIAAGDRLRGQYHQLSADPASLSNLDQDLPNHMQHVLPIHSLPQEWLWCETWCADEELGRAKTIDLCNNPLTKEPKLQRARRQVPEWTGYDEEIAEVLKGHEMRGVKEEIRHGEL